MTSDDAPSQAWPPMPVSVWRVTLRASGGHTELTPTPAGIHSLVSAWLHSSPVDSTGEPHDREHKYAVRWGQVSETMMVLELRLFDVTLTTPLLGRAGAGTSVTLGRAPLKVMGLTQTFDGDFSALTGVAAKGWRVRFPDGITFKRGDAFMPWPAPHAVLSSIQRRLALSYGWAAGERLPREVASSVVPIGVNLQSLRWPERSSQRTRVVSVAVGEVEWICTGSEAVAAYTDRLLQAGQFISAGAKTAWGGGVLELVGRTPLRGDTTP